MQHDVKLDNCTFRGPFLIKKNPERDQLLHNNHGSIPKDFNKNTDTSRSVPPKAIFARHRPKVKSVCFEYPYENINYMNNTNDDTHLIDAYE